MNVGDLNSDPHFFTHWAISPALDLGFQKRRRDYLDMAGETRMGMPWQPAVLG